MIQVCEGNVLNIPSGIIVHGCNSHGVMGAGIALEVKRRFPDAFLTYRKAYEAAIQAGKPGLSLGDIFPVVITETFVIVNAITQKDTGHDPDVKYVSYDAIHDAFKQVNEIAKTLKLPVHFPLIGCGLANGKWQVVSQIIDTCIDDSVEKVLWKFK
jgi:O-acetyl-ADP-ribose deacetylase (regulator of RNase III)